MTDVNRLTILREIAKSNGNMSCDIGKAELVSYSWKFIDVFEQECHLNIDRHEKITHVCCSHQNFITKLKKNPLFVVRRVLYNPQYKILELTGTLPYNGVTIRKSIKGVS